MARPIITFAQSDNAVPIFRTRDPNVADWFEALHPCSNQLRRFSSAPEFNHWREAFKRSTFQAGGGIREADRQTGGY